MGIRASLWILLVYIFISCSDSSPTSTSVPAPSQPPPPPRMITENYTLSAQDGFYEWSHRLKNLGVGDSFEVRFKPLAIHEGESGYANVVEFWLDKLERGRDPERQEAIALVLVWGPGSQWEVGYYESGWRRTGKGKYIPLGGKFQTVDIRKGRGFSEWSINGDVVLHLSDDKQTRVVYTRVVGTEAKFQYETTATASRSLSTAGPELLRAWEGFRER